MYRINHGKAVAELGSATTCDRIRIYDNMSPTKTCTSRRISDIVSPIYSPAVRAAPKHILACMLCYTIPVTCVFPEVGSPLSWYGTFGLDENHCASSLRHGPL